MAQKEESLLFEVSNETREIKVNEPMQVVPVTELNETGIIRYSLEEYMEAHKELVEPKSTLTEVAEPEHESLKITSKIVLSFITKPNSAPVYSQCKIHVTTT